MKKNTEHVNKNFILINHHTIHREKMNGENAHIKSICFQCLDKFVGSLMTSNINHIEICWIPDDVQYQPHRNLLDP